MAAMVRPGSASKFRYLGTMAPGGQMAWLLQDPQENSTFITQEGQPYIIRVVAGPPGKDVLNLTDWNSVPAPAPPAPGQVVSLSELKRALSTT